MVDGRGGRGHANRLPARGGSSRSGAGRVLFVALLSAAVAPELVGLEARNIRFRHVSLEQGLSQDTVLAILQDRDGLMWLGTQEGLNQYDGYEVTTFKPDADDPGSLSHPLVRTLYEDREGVLWVGTDGGGLNRFDRATQKFARFQNDPANPASLSNDRVRVIYQDQAGSLWIGTEGGGLNRFDRSTETFSRFNHNPSNPSSLSNDHIRSLFQDREGALWVGTDGGGLNRMDTMTGRFRHYVHDPGDPRSLGGNRVRAVYEDGEGRLWVGTDESGLDRLDRETETFHHFRHDSRDERSLADDRIRDIFQDSRGTLWIATDGGLCELRSETEGFIRYVHDPTDPVSLGDNRVTTITEDRGGVLWVGTYSGANSWNIGTGFFAHYRNDGSSPNQVSGNVVFSFAESPGDGAIWIATYGNGLNRLDRKTGRFTHYRSRPGDPKSLADDRVMSLLVDRDGILWVGTYDAGLDRLDPRTGVFTHFRHDPADPRSLSRNAVTSIHQDAKGVIWVGTYRGGLNRFDPRRGEFFRYQHDPSNPTSLSSDRVVAIEDGEDGVLWIGTDGGGLNRFDPERGTFSQYRHESDPRTLSSDNVWVVHRDRKSRLWVGTQGGGLNRWDPAPRIAHLARFQRYSTREGLPSTVVNGLLEDDDGNIWISTNRGISRFDPEAETFKNYDATDGLQSPEFNQGAFYRASDGAMFFGGSNGFNSFHPGLVRENPHRPPVTLTAFLKFNQPFDLGTPLTEVAEISLTHRDYVVAFEFAALDYTAPEKNRYRYKLEGFDEDWIDAGRMRRATYTNLSARAYTFRVSAANNDGVWNDEGLSIRVDVIPPPWRTWWAYSLYGFTLVGLVFGYIRRQGEKLEREAEYSRKLQREVDVRTQELAQRNKDLEAFNRKLEEASLTDSLTGFWNRRFLLQQIPKELAQVDRSHEGSGEGSEHRQPRSSILFLMFDLDGFKGLNDTYGHAAGDRVLVQVRQMLLDACRQSDMIVRWGGDEFLLVGRNADPETAESLAERIRTVMEEKSFDVGLEQTVHLSCSIGFAFYPFDPSRPSFFSWEQVIGIADRALYVAKASGRNAWAGILALPGSRSADLFKRISDDLENLVAESVVDLRDSGQRRLRLVREAGGGRPR